MLKPHPTDENLLFDTEDGEITAVSWKGEDVTEFVTEYCDELFKKWETQINA